MGSPASSERGGVLPGLTSWCWLKERGSVGSCTVEVTVKEFSLSLGGWWTSTKWKLVGVKVKPELYGK